MTRAAWLFAAAFALGACDDPEVPVGPPRCEPEHEHEVDRRLKLAFKALVLGDVERARGLFQAVLAEEPSHPEAQLGMRLVAGKHAIEPQAPAPGGALDPAPGTDPAAAKGPVQDGAPDPKAATATPSTGIEIAGAWHPVDFAVDATRWRFEETRALAPLRHARDGTGAVFEYYRARKVDGAVVPEDDGESLRSVLDLIVLHDTHTRTAREAMVELEGNGGSTHFIVDWDGTIYQVLDLAWEANHSQRAAVDARSVSIDIVNPVELGDKPGLPDGEENAGRHRPLSDFVRLQGEEVQQWGYTDAQITALEKLVRTLGGLLPRIPMRVLDGATPASGAIPRGAIDAPDEVRGVIGHLHVSRRALDPGAGFPWEAFARAIRAP